MIPGVRYVAALLRFSAQHAGSVVIAAVLRVRQRPGGVYDRAAREWARGILRWCRIRVTIEGRERLDAAAPVVYIANHTSFVDILAILAELPGTIRFVYKKGMSWIPLLGTAMRAARHIPIDRRNRSAAFAAYDEAAEFIRQGASAVVFAEGTRSRDGRPAAPGGGLAPRPRKRRISSGGAPGGCCPPRDPARGTAGSSRSRRGRSS